MRVVEDLADGGLLFGVHADAIHVVGLLALVEETQRDRLRVDRRDRRDADIEDVLAVAEVDASVLREAALGDVEARHDLQARDDRVLEAGEVVGERDRDEDAVDAVADAQVVLLRLEMDVRRAFGDGLRQHLGDEADDRGVLVGLIGRGDFGGGEIVAFVLEAAGAHAVVLVDEGGHAFGRGEVPLRAAGGEGRDPVGRIGVGRQRRHEAEAAGFAAGEEGRDDLGFGGDARRQDLHPIGIDGGLLEDFEAREAGELGEELGLVEAEGLGEELEAGLPRRLRERGAGLVGQALGEGRGQSVPVDGQHVTSAPERRGPCRGRCRGPSSPRARSRCSWRG